MKKYNKFLFLITILFFISCSAPKNLTTKKINKDGKEILYGLIDKTQLFFDFPEWKEIYDSYLPEPFVVDSLQKLNKNVKIEIFFGTWCGDSRREVPHFLKIMEKSGFDIHQNLVMWALDRFKRIDSGLAAQKNIKRVATFIILRDGNEIGRIVESPKLTLENDLLAILRSK